MMEIQQDRISLKGVKISEANSEETFCFVATVLFDGEPIAQAHNHGHGGETLLTALKGTAKRLAEAEAFAKALPPVGSLEVSLDFLVDDLVDQIYEERQMRSSFKRAMANKVLFIVGDELFTLRRVKLKSIRNKAAVFAELRAKRGEPIIILNELPADEAFALFRKYAIEEDPT